MKSKTLINTLGIMSAASIRTMAVSLVHGATPVGCEPNPIQAGKTYRRGVKRQHDYCTCLINNKCIQYNPEHHPYKKV